MRRLITTSHNTNTLKTESAIMQIDIGNNEQTINRSILAGAREIIKKEIFWIEKYIDDKDTEIERLEKQNDLLRTDRHLDSLRVNSYKEAAELSLTIAICAMIIAAACIGYLII